MRKPGRKLTCAVVELDTLISLAKGAGWLDTDAEVDADGASIGSVV